MPKKSITQKFADSATADSGKRKTQYWDTKTKGFYLEVYDSGHGTFYYRYKGESGKQVHHRLGDRQKLKVKAAREAITLIEGNLAKGIYPDTREEKKQKQAELRKQDITVGDVYDSVYHPHLKAKIVSHVDTNGRFRNHILPSLGKKKLASVKRTDIEKLLIGLRSEKGFMNSSLNRILADVRTFFQYFVEHTDYPSYANPSAGIKKFKEQEKEYRELTVEEWLALLKAAKKSYNPHIYYIIQIWMLTGARRNEVLQAKWNDFNLEERQWVISRNKQNKRDVKALSDEAVQAIQSIPKVPGSEYLFPQRRNIHKPVQNIHHAFKDVKAAAGISKNFTPHDFRHQFATTLFREGVDITLIQSLLAHGQLRTTLRYVRKEHASLVKAANVMGKKYYGKDDDDAA